MNTAIRRRIVFLSFLGMFFLALGTGTNSYGAADLGFSLKLGGGVGYLFNGAGDLEKTRQGYEQYCTDWVETYYTSDFNWKKQSILPGFGIEAMLKIGDSFGVGLGTAYLGFTRKGDYALYYDRVLSEWYGTETYANAELIDISYKMSAIPISLNFYYFLPMDGMSLYFFAGPSIYFGSLTHDWADDYHNTGELVSWYYWDEKVDFQQNMTTQEKASCTAFGFQGGIGLELPLSPMFSLAVEAFGRYAAFSNWTGTWTDSATVTRKNWHELYGWWYTDTANFSAGGSGTIFSYDYYYSNEDKWYKQMWMDDVAPSGSYIRNVRKASINLNSVAILIHAIINF
jgi:hypothetical protein